jgi:hypothetical protein
MIRKRTLLCVSTGQPGRAFTLSTATQSIVWLPRTLWERPWLGIRVARARAS